MIHVILNWLGKEVVEFVEDFGRITYFFIETLKNSFTGKFNVKNVLEQMRRIGNESLPVALVTILFVGMVFAIQIAYEFVKFGANKVVGGIVAVAIARELAPLLTGVVLAGRVGAAIAAELGTMKVTEQIDALRAMGSNPIRYLVVPRFIAAAVMLPVLTVLTISIGFFGGYLVSVALVGISPIDFMSSAESLLKMPDIFGGLFKTIIFGMIIATVACYQGMRAQGGAKGVGEATTNSVVFSLIAIFVANYFLSVAIFK